MAVIIFVRPTLKHQRPQDENQKEYASIESSYKRGTKEVKETTKQQNNHERL